jgi:predicted CxxxxCH...CXXCH cytochrome family protein
MTRSSLRKHIFAISFAGAAALFAAGCGQEEPVDAAPANAGQEVTAVAPRTGNLLAQADFCDDAESPTCIPTGAHGKLAVNFATGHAGFECKECHYIGGRLAFKPASKGGLAFLPAPAARPYFDATAKTCSNIACHTVPAGTFSYYFPGGDGEPVLNTVPYGGGGPQPTPNWYSTGASCSACHVSPPRYNGQPYAWHSGLHGGTLAYNDCQLCHLDATSSYQGGGVWNAVGLSTATNCTVNGVPNQPCSKLHANGALNVNATFRTQCFGCH